MTVNSSSWAIEGQIRLHHGRVGEYSLIFFPLLTFCLVGSFFPFKANHIFTAIDFWFEFYWRHQASVFEMSNGF